MNEVLYNNLVKHAKSLLYDEKFVDILSKYLLVVPDEFWTAPCSSSGNYHPCFDNGVGGVIRHAVLCSTMAHQVCTSMFKDEITDRQHDIVIMACILHDSYKGGEYPGWPTTVIDHGKIAADKLKHWAEDNLSYGDFVFLFGSPHATSSKLYTAMSYHMGIWTQEPVSPMDWYMEEQIVGYCDFFSTRKYLDDGEINKILKNFYV